MNITLAPKNARYQDNIVTNKDTARQKITREQEKLKLDTIKSYERLDIKWFPTNPTDKAPLTGYMWTDHDGEHQVAIREAVKNGQHVASGLAIICGQPLPDETILCVFDIDIIKKKKDAYIAEKNTQRRKELLDGIRLDTSYMYQWLAERLNKVDIDATALHIVETGFGYHIYVRVPKNCEFGTNTAWKTFKGKGKIEFRSSRFDAINKKPSYSYVVAPPSIHPNTITQYKAYKELHSLHDIPLITDKDLLLELASKAVYQYEGEGQKKIQQRVNRSYDFNPLPEGGEIRTKINKSDIKKGKNNDRDWKLITTGDPKYLSKDAKDKSRSAVLLRTKAILHDNGYSPDEIDFHVMKNNKFKKATEKAREKGEYWNYLDTMVWGLPKHIANRKQYLENEKRKEKEKQELMKKEGIDTWEKLKTIDIQYIDSKGNLKLKKAEDIIIDISDYLDYEIDTDDNCYAVVYKQSLKSTYSMTDNKFRNFLASMLIKLEKQHDFKVYKGFTSQNWSTLISVFCDKARAKNEAQNKIKKRAFVRTGWHDGNYYFNTANGKGEVIAMTENGVDIITNPPILFIRIDDQEPINITKEDIKKGSISDIDLVFKHVNVKPELRPLYIMFLLSCMTEPPYSIAYFVGAKDSGKSTTAYVLRNLIDPSKASMTNFQKDLLGLINTIKSNGVLLYDNIQKIEQKDQDIFCKLTFSKGFCLQDRGLYKEYSIKTTKHTPVIITAVFQNTLNTDFFDRCLLFETLKFTTEQTEMDETLWFINYEADRTKIRIALLKLLAEYVKAKKTTDEKLKKTLTESCGQFQSKKRLRNDVKMMTMIEVMLARSNDTTGTLDKIGTTYNAYEKAMNEALTEQLRRNDFMSWLVDEIKNKNIMKGHEYTIKQLIDKYCIGQFNQKGDKNKIGAYFRFYESHLEILGITFEKKRKTKGMVYIFHLKG